MRAYCRPGATPIERLEGYLASCLYSKSDALQQVAELLVRTTNAGPARSQAIRLLFSNGDRCDPAEALGIARAVLLLCGIAPERCTSLSGKPKADLSNLISGDYHQIDLTSPESYAAPSLLYAYHHMGAGFARGIDLVFQVVTGHTLAEHLRRALALLECTTLSEASCEG